MDRKRAAGWPAGGRYEWGHKTVCVREGARRLADGTIALAHALLDSGVRALVQELGRSLAAAIIPAAAVPSKVLGVSAGRLAAGLMADIMVLDETPQSVRTFVGGEKMFRRSTG